LYPFFQFFGGEAIKTAFVPLSRFVRAGPVQAPVAFGNRFFKTEQTGCEWSK